MNEIIRRRDMLRQSAGLVLAGGLTSLADSPAEEPRVLRRRCLPRAPEVEVPLLGYGGIRLPTLGRDKNRIDLPRATELIDYAYRHGVTWFDTGWSYHEGNSEPCFGQVLAHYPRTGFTLSDKLPTWLIKKAEDAKTIFETQLKRCGVDYFDFYLLHSLGDPAQYRRVYHDFGVLDWLRGEMKRGRIRHLAFSFHGKSPFLEQVLDDVPEMAYCMILLNAFEAHWNPDNLKLREILHRRHVPIVGMEPLGGGRIGALRGKALAILQEARPGSTSAQWAFRYAASVPGVACLISGMGKMVHLRENVATFSQDFKPFTSEESDVYAKAVAAYMANRTIPCTACRYCVPCPYHVPIPEIFSWYNEFAAEGRLPTDTGPNDSQVLRRNFLVSYYNTFPAAMRADRCINCRECLNACPQWVFRIPVELRRIAGLVEKTRTAYLARGGRLYGKGVLPC